MAAPVLGKIGRRIYRDARGRFISKAKYQLEQRRGPGGRFLTRKAAKAQRGREAFWRAKWGAPPAGKNWTQIAGKYPERFEQYMDEADL